MSEGNKTVCPKCGKGQIICTYLGPMPDAYYPCHGWRHECTNPTCGFAKRFNVEEENLDLPGFPPDFSGIPIITPDGDGYVEEIGPGKKGGCPGHKYK